jgi:DNA-directed RNA polymerase sigma subunit (sigma70/sigma32)
VDSQAKKEQDGLDLDIDAELEEWLDKQAADAGISREELRQMEVEAWERWKSNPNPQDFGWLYNSHQPLIQSAGDRYLRTAQLPKAAVKSRLLRNYVDALETYDPTRGAQLHSHVTNRLGYRMNRFIQRYANVGRIPEERSWMIPLIQNREATLQDTLGRKPSDAELADDILLSTDDLSALRKQQLTPRSVGTVRKELRRDLVAEEAGGEAQLGGRSFVEQQAVFLHGSLNPEQQLVLEHTYEGFGKPLFPDVNDLSKETGLSPQKVRAIKKQLERKLERYYRMTDVSR